MSNIKLYKERPKFGSEVIQIADGTIPYTFTHDEFHSTPVSDDAMKRRQAIYDMQALLAKSSSNDSVASSSSLVHRFTPGIYAREYTMSAGTIIAGQRHHKEHLVFVLEGYSTVYTENGREEIIGPCTFISPAGTKRVLVNHTKAVWTTVHFTTSCSVEEAEAELIINEDVEYEEAMSRTGNFSFEDLVSSNFNQLKE
jgi:quercetin dioxygenase-like cupin family protein